MESEQNHVPEGWISVRIDEIVEVNPGKPPKDLLPADAPVSFVPMPAVDAEKGAITEPEVREYHKVRSGYTAFRNDDLIVAKITPCMENGKAAVARDLVNGLGFGSSEFHVLRSRGTVLPEYLYHFVRQQSYRDSAEKQMTGSVGQKRVPADFIKSSVIPLPPLPEQRRIVARLEALLADLERVRGRLDAVAATMQRFRQAVLAAACDGTLTEEWRGEGELENTDLPSAWSWKSCEEICEKGRTISYGVIKLGQHDESGIPTLRSSDVRHLKIENHHVKKVSREIEANYRRTSLKGGEVLVTVRGTLGGVAAVPPEMRGYNISREVAMVPASATIVDARYLAFAIGSVKSQKWLNETVKGVTYSGINIMDLKRLPILLPPLLEQHEIVRRVDALFALADRIEGEVSGALERVEALREAVLAKAFRGELVPTEAEVARREGRAYEPAAVLLERVRAGRAVSVKSPRRRKSAGTVMLEAFGE